MDSFINAGKEFLQNQMNQNQQGGNQGQGQGYNQGQGNYGNQGENNNQGGYGQNQGYNDNQNQGYGQNQGYDQNQGYNQGGNQGYNQSQGGNQGYNQHQGGNQGYGGPQGGNNAFGGAYPPGGGVSSGSDEQEFQRAHQEANNLAGNSGDSSMFSNILGSLSNNQHQIGNQNIDEGAAMQAHQDNYNNNNSGPVDSHSMGSAAAMQALKNFTQGGGGNQSKGQFIGMAMSEASKLFDNNAAQGQVADGASKSSAVQKAGEMALKMYMQSQGGSGGASGLMSMASKFM